MYHWPFDLYSLARTKSVQLSKTHHKNLRRSLFHTATSLPWNSFLWCFFSFLQFYSWVNPQTSSEGRRHVVILQQQRFSAGCFQSFTFWFCDSSTDQGLSSDSDVLMMASENDFSCIEVLSLPWLRCLPWTPVEIKNHGQKNVVGLHQIVD